LKYFLGLSFILLLGSGVVLVGLVVWVLVCLPLFMVLAMAGVLGVFACNLL
jgi:hypothetical protein